MKLTKLLLVLGALAALAVDMCGASSAGADSPFDSPFATPVSPSSLLNGEIAVLMRRGLSRATAVRAVAVNGEIAQARLVNKLETVTGQGFGGAWFDSAAAQLHVGVTSRADRGAAQRAIEHMGLKASVALTSVRSSWAQLLAVQMRWNRRLVSLFARAEVVTALDARRNALVVTVSSSVPRARRAGLEREAAVAGVNVDVINSQHLSLGVTGEAMTECNVFTPDKARCDKPLTSGITIEGVGVAKTKCTAGPMGIPVANKQQTYLLTAGHCIKLDEGPNKPWYAFFRNGERVEIGKTIIYEIGRAGDYAGILVENSAWKTNVANDPLYAVTARWGLGGNASLRSYPIISEQTPVQGKPNCHVGEAIAESCGTVGLSNVSLVMTNEGVTVEHLQEDVGAESSAGDSGGPWVFTSEKGGIYVEGTHVGRRETNAVYAPIETTLNALGLELLTESNEFREVKLTVLPLPSASSQLRFTISSTDNGPVILETVSGKQVECKVVSGSGELTSETLGLMELRLLDCILTGLSLLCTGLNATVAGEILFRGEFHLRPLLAGSARTVSLVVLPSATHYSCIGLLFSMSGCVSSMDLLTAPGGANVVEQSRESIFGSFLQKKGGQEITSVDDSTGRAMEECRLKLRKEAEGYENTGLQGEFTIAGFEKGGTRVAVTIHSQ